MADLPAKYINATPRDLKRGAGAVSSADPEVGFNSRSLGRASVSDPAVKVAGIADGQHDLSHAEIGLISDTMFSPRNRR
jgi:hypothetical protein